MIRVRHDDLANATRHRVLQRVGGFFKAEVYVLRLESGDLVVCKDYRRFKTNLFAALFSMFLVYREFSVLRKLNDWRFSPRVYGSPSRLLLIQEFIAGQDLSRCSLNERQNIWQKLSLALRELHQKGVCHNDVRGANVLVTEDGQVVFIDFTSAISLPDWLGFKKMRRLMRFFDLRHLLKLKNKLGKKLSARQAKIIQRPDYQHKILTLWKKRLLPALKRPFRVKLRHIVLLLAVAFVYAHAIR